MDALEPDDLYEERTSVTYARPILQGDVFEGVIVPGFGDDPLIVQVVTHPCSMRRGRELNERIQVAPVEKYQKVTDWDSHLRIMPLPDLREDGGPYASRLSDTSAVPARELTLDKRVASLSQQGIILLQQRIVMHSTRIDMQTGPLREQSAPVLAEAEMQEIWIETLLGGSGVLDIANVQRAGDDFQAWLDENERKRRHELKSEANHARLRKAVREEANGRKDTGS